MRVVLADDEKSIRVTLGDDIRDAGHEAAVFEDGRQAFEHICAAGADVLICDLKMPGMDGLSLLKAVKEQQPLLKVIVITGYGTIDTAVEAMKFGAYDYVLKPFINGKIIHMLANIADLQRVVEENRELKKRMTELQGDFPAFEGMVGTSRAMQDVFRRIESVAATDANVLIQGESGTGKELVARALHSLSPRASFQMIVLSCAASPENLIEDELFGHEPGAYTGAIKQKKGKIERADRSTLFIDDIDDMSLNTQAKLVRVLEERTFERLGGTTLLSADFRIITASKKDLRQMAAEGTFREDLFFRLNIIPVNMPPLRAREGDIELMAFFFKNKYARRTGAYFTEETVRAMKAYGWPGNVRELENAIIRAAALSSEQEPELKMEHIFQSLTVTAGRCNVPGGELTGPLADALAVFEKRYIEQALKSTGAHRSRTADLLGISRKTLWEKVKAYGIEP